MLNIAITGAAGRMGRTLVQMVHAADDLKLAGATDRPDSDLLGKDIGTLCGLGDVGVPLQESLDQVPGDVDVVIDFTTPDATMSHLATCAQRGFGIVIGTTGLNDDQKAQITSAAQQVPVVFAPNMSVGVNVLTNLVEQTARILGDDYDVEIVEMHHRHKVDAPSGTAFALGEAAAKGLDRNLKDCAIYGREGAEGPRNTNTIGFATLRGGDVVGEHTVIYAGDGERIEITHKASSRNTFARGAVRAARWLEGKSKGQFSMTDVLGL